jgi:type I restriction enzyme S subunit
MNTAQVLDHFDRIWDASEGIPRLRRFILELAMRGKLTGANNVKEQTKPLGSLAEFIMGQAPPGTACNQHGEGTLFVKVGEFGEKYPDYRAWTTEPLKLAKTGDVLICVVGATVGKLNLAVDCAIGRSVAAIRPRPMLDMQYLYFSLMPFTLSLRENARGTAQGVISKPDLASIQVWCPPLAEQHRIVAKLDELMALCDRLEAAQAERESRRDKLVAASLHRLNNGADADEFRDHARLHLRHLPRLTTRPEHIQQLRQTILNLAVRGKLVAQDPNDEPASELLKRIKGEKERLIRDGSIRKEKPLPPVAEEEAPFPIRTSWRWARIGTCSLLTEYGTSMKSDHIENGVPVLKMGDIQDGKVHLGSQKRVPRSIDDLPQLFLKRFDLLYNRTNSAELVGKTGIYMGDDDAYTFASYLIRIRFLNDLISPVYSNIAMNSPYFRGTQIVPQLQQQCGQANVNGTKLRNMIIPLPPVAEQRRIVAKVDELMALCDRLEAQLTTTQTESRRLLEAMLHEALEEGKRGVSKLSAKVDTTIAGTLRSKRNIT